MLFSKSFGYALRSLLFLAAAEEGKGYIQLNKIAAELNIPRHFLGKIMKRLVKEGVLASQKGPTGGFIITEQTLKTSLLKVVTITGETNHFDSCVLRINKCNTKNPCPMHDKAQLLRAQWMDLLSSTTVGDLLKKGQPDFLKSIITV
jgi:Rrf2 family transcriptional regulator, iron-sulfur cluster assembly transcription factor